MKRLRQPQDTDAFYEFWCEYPRPEGKAAARRAFWRATKRATPAEILWGLRSYPFSPDTRYQPHPATWLNQDRWLVEEPSAPPTTSGPPPKPTLSDMLRGITGG
jgi:hypothetical protein